MLKFFKRNRDDKNKDQKTDQNTAKDSSSSGFFSNLYAGLSKTRKQMFAGLSGGLGSLFTGKVNIDDDLFEELEDHLLSADLGIEVTAEILDELTREIRYKDGKDINNLKIVLKRKLLSILQPCQRPLDINTVNNSTNNTDSTKGSRPYVILVVGVNGAGKTTTIGKIAKQFQDEGYSVMLAAGDTFRAAAIEQLVTWGERNNIQVVAQQTGSDSASVIFDAYQSANSKGINILIADTAGRLHTQSHLMQELAKIKRVIKKQEDQAPDEVLLVLDAGMGQNALAQAKKFQSEIGVTGIILTKLDGTAKGGIIFAIARQLNIPIRYIGVGEGINDLQPFDAESFVSALIDDK
jgi:fused signal recognition particle receptor